MRRCQKHRAHIARTPRRLGPHRTSDRGHEQTHEERVCLAGERRALPLGGGLRDDGRIQ